jgi:hypothetical protein
MRTVSKEQIRSFRAFLWRDACAAMGWDAEDDEFRFSMLSEWLGREIRSFKEVGRLEEFDKVKAECLALSQPANVNGQIRQINQPLIRLRWKCRRMAPQAYREAIMRARFHTTNLDDLDEGQLTQLRNTLAARSNSLRRRAQQPVLAGPPEDENEPF